MARLERSFGCVALTLGVSVSLLLSDKTASAQGTATYGSLVDQYSGGDPKGAVAQLARWNRGDVTRASSEWTRRLTVDQLRAAAMLHTDAGYELMIEGESGLGAFQISMAQRIVNAMITRNRGVASSAAFGRRWCELIASWYTAYGLLSEADRVVVDGLSLFPRDPMLYVARGVIQETRATLNAPDQRGVTMGGNRTAMTPSKLIDAAAADYRRALELDDHLAVASLRLGRLHFLVGDARAVSDLSAALTNATDDGVRYLAHLFLGALAVRDNRLENARQAYEAALALGVAYQTPYIALSRVEEALGHNARARAIAQEYAELTTKADDPWWDFHLGGFDAGALAWLRDEAQRR